MLLSTNQRAKNGYKAQLAYPGREMSHRERRRAESSAGVLINEIFINDRSLHNSWYFLKKETPTKTDNKKTYSQNIMYNETPNHLFYNAEEIKARQFNTR